MDIIYSNFNGMVALIYVIIQYDPEDEINE